MNQTDPLTPETVADWIREHPDLLCRHPDLIDVLDLPGSSDVASLTQHQVQRLRRRNEQLEHHLQQLSAIAGDNERLMQRLHQLTLEVLSTTSGQAFISRMLQGLQEDFKADDVRLHLVDAHEEIGAHPGVVAHQGEPPDWLEEQLARSDIYCGRLTRAKLSVLFPDSAEGIGSCALIPVAGSGLLAVGSIRQDHFHPGIGTLFLELLGNTIAWRLKLAEREDRKRA